MLPPFIIEQIRKREEEERARHEEQPRLELPIERRQRVPGGAGGTVPEEEKRGVIIVDLLGD